MFRTKIVLCTCITNDVSITVLVNFSLSHEFKFFTFYVNDALGRTPLNLMCIVEGSLHRPHAVKNGDFLLSTNEK